jgi:hypothetical protein
LNSQSPRVTAHPVRAAAQITIGTNGFMTGS